MKKSHIREWEENKFKWALIRRKKSREIQGARQRLKLNLKANLS